MSAGLHAMAAAAEVLAAAELMRRKQEEDLDEMATTVGSTSQGRSRSLLSDSTEAEEDGVTGGEESEESGRGRGKGRKRRCEQRDDRKGTESKRKMTDNTPRTQPGFPAELLTDLAGSTSAEVRRMNEDERALVHYKRRLRNRESAKRSRARRQATISDIQTELEDLREVTANLVERCVRFARANREQGRELETLRKEKSLLESMLRSAGGDDA